MKIDRRKFLAASMLAIIGNPSQSAFGYEEPDSPDQRLSNILNQPVLKTQFLDEPVIIQSIELLRHGKIHLLRVRSQSGVTAVTVPHASKTKETSGIFLNRIAPFFINKDARQLESIMWELYRHKSNYKFQGLAFWIGVAAIEMALLELLGQTAKRPLADFIGGQLKRDIPVYYASGNRGNSPEDEIEHLQKLVENSGAKAIKFRLGGRMSRNKDSRPGRSEKLIPLVRKTFGDSFTLYADSNSSYDSKEAIRIGKIMEEHNYSFFEEPCQFDDLWSTKKVTETLDIPIAGGEQEYSMNRWRWMIANRGVDIVQPDLHYGGGMIRATKVARMAAAVGMPVVPHMSGGGLGYVDVVQFAAFTPNIGPYMEFKGNTDLPIECDSSTLKCKDGIVKCPNGIGNGVKIDPNFVKKATVVKKL